jgi:multiple sugar transport system substrate-binding protein
MMVMSSALAMLAPTCASAQSQTAPAGRISFMVFGDPAEKAAYDGLVKAFTQKHPGVAANLIHIPGQNAYRTRMATDFAAGTPADVTLINYRRYASFAKKGALEPLGPYLAQSKIIKAADFYQEAMEPYYYDDKLSCLPQNLSSLVVYYNKKLFDRAGITYPSADWTWDEFLQTAKALTRDTDGDRVVDQFGLGTEVSIFRVAPFIWQNGGKLVDRDKNPTRLTILSMQALEAIQWFVDLQVKHKVVPDAVQEKSEGSESRFLNGRLGMFLNSRRGVPTYREIRTFDWDVAPLPRRQQSAGILHADAFCMAAKSTNKAAAWAFIEFAMSGEGQTILAESGRTVPSMKSIANSPVFLEANAAPKNSKVFLDTIPHIRAVPVMPTWVDIEDTIGKDLERAMYGQTTAHEAVAAAIQRTEKYFGDD